MQIQNRVTKNKFEHFPEEYKYSSAIDYTSGKGILKVEVIKD